MSDNQEILNISELYGYDDEDLPNTEHVMRWRLTLEEFGPELKYIKGENNVVADTLSCLEKSNN